MISRATSGTGRLVFLAWRRSRLNAVGVDFLGGHQHALGLFNQHA
jgi:hypothetical protein